MLKGSIPSEKSVVTKQDVSKQKKLFWDTKVKARQFSNGEEVLMRKPGINMKLGESWESPHTVVRRNNSLSYKIDTGDRVIFPFFNNARVNRFESVFEPDTVSHTIIDRYSEVQLS